jgi:hypothetical protein
MSEMGGTLEQELQRTAEMMIDLAENKGVYFAIALLHDLEYPPERTARVLKILERMPGGIKKMPGDNK